MKKTTKLFCLTAVLALTACSSSMRYFQGQDDWYRDLRIDGWQASGAKKQTIAQVINRIEVRNQNQDARFDLATTDYKSGNWHYEWDSAGQQANANGDFLAASMYYTIAAYPFINEKTRSNDSYQMALDNYQQAVESDGSVLEQLTVSTQDGEAKAFLHLPEQQPNKTMPVLVMTNGSDHALTQLYPIYRDYIKKAGWAMVTFDLPGLGSNNSFAQHTDRTNVIHQQLIKKLKQDPRLQSDKIVLMGKSFGGNAAIKTAFTNSNDIAGAISWCGAVNGPFLKFGFIMTLLPDMTRDALLSRFALPQEQLGQQGSALALSTQYLGKVKTKVPMLAINQGSDKISPVSDMRLIAESSTQGKYVIVEENITQGHCSSDHLTMPLVVNWLNQQFPMN